MIVAISRNIVVTSLFFFFIQYKNSDSVAFFGNAPFVTKLPASIGSGDADVPAVFGKCSKTRHAKHPFRKSTFLIGCTSLLFFKGEVYHEFESGIENRHPGLLPLNR